MESGINGYIRDNNGNQIGRIETNWWTKDGLAQEIEVTYNNLNLFLRFFLLAQLLCNVVAQGLLVCECPTRRGQSEIF